jgi:dienelactone hydrolase
MPDAGPNFTDFAIFSAFAQDDARDMWTYHAVSAVIRAHSFLASRPEVDSHRVAITGISWGGYLTCIAAGLDHRFKAAVSVYGCGYLHVDSVWLPILASLGDDRRTRWVEAFDPSNYVLHTACPMLFVTGTNDFAYPLSSLQQTYRLIKSPVTLSVEIDRPHGHIWTFPEVEAFIDSKVNHGSHLPALTELIVKGNLVTSVIEHGTKVIAAELNYTLDKGSWVERRWYAAPASVDVHEISARLPEERPSVCYLRVTDARGCSVTTPHVEWPHNPALP